MSEGWIKNGAVSGVECKACTSLIFSLKPKAQVDMRKLILGK
jgi:hypothetical protein